MSIIPVVIEVPAIDRENERLIAILPPSFYGYHPSLCYLPNAPSRIMKIKSGSGYVRRSLCQSS